MATEAYKYIYVNKRDPLYVDLTVIWADLGWFTLHDQAPSISTYFQQLKYVSWWEKFSAQKALVLITLQGRFRFTCGMYSL